MEIPNREDMMKQQDPGLFILDYCSFCIPEDKKSSPILPLEINCPNIDWKFVYDDHLNQYSLRHKIIDVGAFNLFLKELINIHTKKLIVDDLIFVYEYIKLLIL